jgi:dihydrofolate synthase/folylpolyglutamate synthase
MSGTSSLKNLESYLQNLTRFGIRHGLDRINALLQTAPLSHLAFPCILVGGTNGKGSTCDFLARALAADGLKTGLFTSPHLYHYNERIRILPSNDHQLFEGAISDADSNTLLEAAMPALQQVSQKMQDPTEFETLTLLALLHFTRQQVDAAVLEVGLGGRWDCTNAVHPLVSVLTHVDLDHCDRLGNTREEIAIDKVHIARPGRILVSAETRPEVLKVLFEYCQNTKVLFRPWRAPQYKTDPDWKAPMEIVDENDFQTINLQTAMQARLAFYESIHQSAPQQQSKVLLSAVPGRYEIIREKPMLIADGANNPDGARHLASRLKQELSLQPNRNLILVLGILADKDYEQMIEILAPTASAVIATQSPSPRSAPAEDIAAKVSSLGIPVHTILPVTAAVQKALEIATPEDIVVLTGSFYTLGELDRSKVLI